MSRPPSLVAKRQSRNDRANNVQEILAALRSQGPLTQAELSRTTNLSRATVNQIVQGLRDAGTIEYQWKNKREALVMLASTRGAAASVIVTDRLVHAIVFDFTAQQRFDLFSSGPQAADGEPTSPASVLDMVARLVAIVTARGAPLMGVAIAIAGPIERRTGAIAPWAWQRLPEWRDVNIAQYFARHLRVPIVVDNDANFAALAEWTWGVGHGCGDFLYMTCAEGIGGGIVIDGRIYHGGTGIAGEFGHMVIEGSGDLCFCGSRGCLTSFAAEHAILKALGDRRKRRTSLAEVIADARHGDAACQRVLIEAGHHLGKALATVGRVLAPSTIVIGGTLGTAGDLVLDGLKSSAEVMNLRTVGDAPEFKAAAIVQHATELGGLAAILSELDLGLSSLSPWMLSPVPLVDAKTDAG